MKILMTLATLAFTLSAGATSPSPLVCGDGHNLVEDGYTKGPFKDKRNDLKIRLFNTLQSAELENRIVKNYDEALALTEELTGDSDPAIVEFVESKYFEAKAEFDAHSGIKSDFSSVYDIYQLRKTLCWTPGKRFDVRQFVYELTSAKSGVRYTVLSSAELPFVHTQILKIIKQ